MNLNQIQETLKRQEVLEDFFIINALLRIADQFKMRIEAIESSMPDSSADTKEKG